MCIEIIRAVMDNADRKMSVKSVSSVAKKIRFMTKIVVTGTRGIPNVMGGVETHCEELFPRIAKMEFDVTVIRRSTYVHDGLTEWKGVKLVDVDTPKKKAFEAIIHT